MSWVGSRGMQERSVKGGRGDFLRGSGHMGKGRLKLGASLSDRDGCSIWKSTLGGRLAQVGRFQRGKGSGQSFLT